MLPGSLYQTGKKEIQEEHLLYQNLVKIKTSIASFFKVLNKMNWKCLICFVRDCVLARFKVFHLVKVILNSVQFLFSI